MIPPSWAAVAAVAAAASNPTVGKPALPPRPQGLEERWWPIVLGNEPEGWVEVAILTTLPTLKADYASAAPASRYDVRMGYFWRRPRPPSPARQSCWVDAFGEPFAFEPTHWRLPRPFPEP